MAKVLKELAVVTSTYVDQRDGLERKNYENVGVLMESDDGGNFILMKRHFNPAGIPTKQGSDKIFVSCFDPKPKDGGNERAG